MATVTHNHSSYDKRLNFIKKLLMEHGLHFEDSKVTPIAYEADCPFKYNNFVYKISLPANWEPPSDNEQQQQQPGCVPIPSGVHELILRLNNPDAEGMRCDTRIENEVASIAIASAALETSHPGIVPRVFGWASCASGRQGWILQEAMSGAPVDEALGSMSSDEQRNIMSQMASILKALQDYQLPGSINGWGGLTFDDSKGIVISGPMTSVNSGPWPSLEASFHARLQIALEKADENKFIQGWRANGLRERIEAFIQDGISALLAGVEHKTARTMIHADFTANNLLFDPASGCITALLDYDFSCILHPAYEYLRSFDGAGGQLRGWSGEEDSDGAALRKAKLSGIFPIPLPPNGDSGIKWDLAKLWEDELERLDVLRPSTMIGIDHIANIDGILRAILPWLVSNVDFVDMNTEDAILKFRERGEESLSRLLAHVGF